MIVGTYINLKKSKIRAEACLTQISQLGIKDYNRISAIDGAQAQQEHSDIKYSKGKLGCWLSHLNAMEHSLSHEHHQHILEDDFVFTNVFRSFRDNFDSHTSALREWDIVFCDVDLANMHNVAEMGNLIKHVSSLERAGKISFENAKKLYSAGNSSYIINKTSKQKIYSLMKEGFKSGLPNDLYLRKLIREDKVKAFVTLPFVTTVSDEFNDSTILGDISEANPSILFATIFRQSLAWGADTRSLLNAFRDRINQLRPISDRSMIYAQLVAHFVSNDYKPY